MIIECRSQRRLTKTSFVCLCFVVRSSKHTKQVLANGNTRGASANKKRDDVDFSFDQLIDIVLQLRL